MKINLTQWLCKTGKCACLHLQNKIFHILSLSSGSLSNIACAGVLLEVSGNLKIPQLWDRSGHKWELRTLCFLLWPPLAVTADIWPTVSVSYWTDWPYWFHSVHHTWGSSLCRNPFSHWWANRTKLPLQNDSKGLNSF